MPSRTVRTAQRLLFAGALSLLLAGPTAAQPAAAPAIGLPAADALAAAPKVRISNGQLDAIVLLPDGEKGFYRGVRFDWSGLIASLRYRDQEFYGLWFDGISPDVRDYAFTNGRLMVSRNTAALGPADAYDPSEPVGWAEAAPGGAFLKIGVGLLRKPADGAAYSSFRNYDWVDPGVWKVTSRSDRVSFTHIVSAFQSGYGYEYRKDVRLLPGRPMLEIRHSLKNTGSRKISTTTFNHNFLTLGGDPTAAGLEAGATFGLEPGRPLRDVARLDRTRLIYNRALGAEEVFSTPFAVGEGASAYDVHVTGPQGAGFRAQGDRPLTSLQLWSIPRTVSLEPFVSLEAAPGQTVVWTYTYTYTYSAGPPR